MIERRPLGAQGLVASAQGLGCMGMSMAYGTRDDTESIATIHRALDLGVTLIDTAEAYGPHHNEELVGRALAGRRDDAVVATKFGITRDWEADTFVLRPNGTPENVRRSCEGSLSLLGTDHIDLYYQHRIDPDTPIEETVGAMAELVREGKVCYIGISEASEETLRRAHAVHPITALQTEYSLWTRGPEDGILDVCRELGIGFVAYSPLGRGFLTGTVRSLDELEQNDFRRLVPRFQGENLERNGAIVERLEEIAAGRGVTPAQLALAWVHGQGADVFPIPGTKRRTYLEQNVAAFDIELTPDELAALAEVAEHVSGDRYDPSGMRSVNR